MNFISASSDDIHTSTEDDPSYIQYTKISQL